MKTKIFQLNKKFNKRTYATQFGNETIEVWLYLDEKKETEKAYCLKIANTKWEKYLPKSQVEIKTFSYVSAKGTQRTKTVLIIPCWIIEHSSIEEYAMKDSEYEKLITRGNNRQT